MTPATSCTSASISELTTGAEEPCEKTIFVNEIREQTNDREPVKRKLPKTSRRKKSENIENQ